MKDYQKIFKRYEIKYLLTQTQRKILEEGMTQYMTMDKYGESTICNIYFDTPSHLLIRRSLDKPIYKEKLRIRSYGVVNPENDVFVELKKKYNGVVYKRRISLPEKSAMAYLCEGLPLNHPSQISKEIDYFRFLYQELIPSMFLSYNRAAYFSNSDENFRITFDENILWRDQNLSLTAAAYGQTLLDSGQALMEVKTISALPLWLTHLLNKNDIFKTSFSKYGKAYLAQSNQNSIKKTRGVYCA